MRLHSKFRKFEIYKDLLALLQFSNYFGTSLLPSGGQEFSNWYLTNVIHLLQMKTADTAHKGNFASVTRPFSDFSRGACNDSQKQNLNKSFLTVHGL